jgi:hypothetical protein
MEIRSGIQKFYFEKKTCRENLEKNPYEPLKKFSITYLLPEKLQCHMSHYSKFFLTPACHYCYLLGEWQLMEAWNVRFAPLTGGPHTSAFFFLLQPPWVSHALQWRSQQHIHAIWADRHCLLSPTLSPNRCASCPQPTRPCYRTMCWCPTSTCRRTCGASCHGVGTTASVVVLVGVRVRVSGGSGGLKNTRITERM